MPTIFNFTSGVVADTDPYGGPSSIQATQTIGADTLTVALDSLSGAQAVVMDEVAFFGRDVSNLDGSAFEMVSGSIAFSVTLSLDNGPHQHQYRRPKF